MSTRLRVGHVADDRFAVEVRGHTVYVDQPLDVGGSDQAPTPTELFVAGLASCVAFYARRYLHRHGLPTTGLAVSASFESGGRPARVTRIEVTVDVPDTVPVGRRDALLAVSRHCIVHTSLLDPPDVEVQLSPAPPLAVVR